MLISLSYCAGFGYHLLNAVDGWINNLTLVFVVWSEAIASQTVYRWRDIVDQVGMKSYIIFNFGYIGGQVIGVVVAQTVSAPAGAGVGFGIFILCAIAAVLLGKTPIFVAPRFWGKQAHVSRFWYLMFYSGNQLRHDLNYHIAWGMNWNIPVVWGALIHIVSAPILAIIVSFAYPDFAAVSNDPLQVYGFIVAHCIMLIVVIGFVVPRMLDVFVPAVRRDEKVVRTDPMEVMTGEVNSAGGGSLETGTGSDSDAAEKKSDGSVK